MLATTRSAARDHATSCGSLLPEAGGGQVDDRQPIVARPHLLTEYGVLPSTDPRPSPGTIPDP